MGPRTSRFRVIGGVSGAHAKRVVGCQVGHCIQVIGCRVAPSLPPPCIMQGGCSHLMQGDMVAFSCASEAAECTSPRQRGHWIRVIGACACPTCAWPAAKLDIASKPLDVAQWNQDAHPSHWMSCRALATAPLHHAGGLLPPHAGGHGGI